MEEKPINFDAWSSGQVGSKLWLCQHLESLSFPEPPVIWILGGWYGMAAFLLLSRERLQVKHIRSFDIDPQVEAVADLVNENWVWREWKFKAFTCDANSLEFGSGGYGPAPDLVINTSTEHFAGFDWFTNIPKGTLIALQSTDLLHPEHLFNVRSLDELHSLFPMRQRVYEGSLGFSYPDFTFNRFMLIGKK